MTVWAPVKISISEAATFLHERYGSLVRHVAPVAEQGLWSSTYRFSHGPHERVVRFGPSREAFERDAFVARHAPARLPVPPVHEIGAAFGHFFAISDFAPGAIIDKIGAAEMRRTLPSLFGVLDAVREIDLGATTGYGYWDSHGAGIDPTWEYVMVGGIPRWRAGVAGSKVGPLQRLSWRSQRMIQGPFLVVVIGRPPKDRAGATALSHSCQHQGWCT